MTTPTNPAGNNNLGIPYIGVPFVDMKTGQVQKYWWDFLNNLYQRVGGSVAPSNSQLAAMINTAAMSMWPNDENAGDDGMTLQGQPGMPGTQGQPGISVFFNEDDQEDIASTALSVGFGTPLQIASGGTGNTTGAASVNANLTGPITSVGNATSIASQTGTGSTFVMQASPTLTTPNLGTPSALVATNISGTASALSIGGNAATATAASSLTSGATGTTPGQFDISTKVPTTAFVAEQLGNYSGSTLPSGTVSLTYADFGSVVLQTNSGGTVTLPNPAGINVGFSIMVAALMTTGSTTIAVAIDNIVYDNFGNSSTTFVLQAGECARFTIDTYGHYVVDSYSKVYPINLKGTSGSLGGSPLLAGSTTTGTVSITGATTSMSVIVTPVTYPGDGVGWAGYVSSSGVVTVVVTGIIAVTPTATTYNVRVIQ